jgi:hypothetical protein
MKMENDDIELSALLITKYSAQGVGVPIPKL